MRTFDTGATRDDDSNKPDYAGFLSPRVLIAYGEYMTKHQLQADGTRRSSRNWQKGIPTDAYVSSMFRHFVAVWDRHEAGQDALPVQRENLCALLFNVMGMLHEITR